MIIVYQSETGFTQAYAQMLGRAEKLEVCTLAQAKKELEPGSQVVYMGPLMAGHITGLDQAVRAFQVKAAVAVGMSRPGEGLLRDLGRANYVPGGPIFYLRGGYAPEKLGWLKRHMVGMVTRSMRRALEEKSCRTPQEQQELDMLLKGGSYVSQENLEPVRNFLKGLAQRRG